MDFHTLETVHGKPSMEGCIFLYYASPNVLLYQVPPTGIHLECEYVEWLAYGYLTVNMTENIINITTTTNIVNMTEMK